MKTLIGCAILLVAVVFLYERHPGFFNAVTPATPYGYNQQFDPRQPQFDPQTGQPAPYAYQGEQSPAYSYQYAQPAVQPQAYPYPQPAPYGYSQPAPYAYQAPCPHPYYAPVCPQPVYQYPHKEVLITPWFRSYR